MYSLTLALHSFFRWMVLLALVCTITTACHGWLTRKRFRKFDTILRQVTVSVSHVQFLLGVILYCASPITRYFLSHFSEGVHNRDVRFFGMEHITMMFIGVALITQGSTISKRKATDVEKFKTVTLFFAIALLIIFLSIPWPFSPFTARPFWRF
jgi:hypothetical protein